MFHRRRFFHGQAIQGAEAPDIAWLDPTGKEMSDEAWTTAFVRCLGVQLFGGEIDVDEHGEAIVGDTMLLLVQRRPRQHDSVRAAATGN